MLSFGRRETSGLSAQITVHDRRFYSQLLFGGGIGAAEAYIRCYWDAEDLTTAMRVLAQNAEILSGMEKGAAQLLKPIRSAANWLRRNTRAGSKRNISAHYDLSNELFGLMLDPTMTYSSGVFPTPTSSLEEASTEKYDRICRKLKLTPADHVLEIGTGWGGFAEHAARRYGCRVTTTTISDEQHQYAHERFRQGSLEAQITLLQKDYRDLSGKYDKLVSIEMIEAVGRKFFSTYFSKCSELLKPDGAMLLQAITIPDHRYDGYCKSVDFIQRYIFPGGFLPSIGAIANCVGKETDFRFFHAEDFGPHYAETLACWRRNFWDNIAEVSAIGFDERFIRTWHYYLCYCEAGFRERQIGVSQLMFTKPNSRHEPILAKH
jgi:cyclopropane-fatty-acyl-phospholipid synthase